MKDNFNSHELHNQQSWEYANSHFNRYKGNYANAIRSQNDVIPPEVIENLSPKSDDSILHLLCNDGREAAYLAFNYGCHVYGVDFSHSAIKYANRINKDLSLKNSFCQSEVFDWLLKNQNRSFSKVLITLGAIKWISDLKKLFNLIHRVIVSRGILVLWDFHPLLYCFTKEGQFTNDYPIGSQTFLRDYGVVDYVSNKDKYVLLANKKNSRKEKYNNAHSVYLTRHSLSSIINSLIEMNFTIMKIEEYNFLWEEKYLPWLIETSPRRFEAPNLYPSLPLSFLIKCYPT